MDNQGLDCVEVELEFSPKKRATEAQVRNRRYKRLLQLRNNGFFSEDSIKLRHPMLYHTYLGKNSQRSTGTPEQNCTLSQFLEKNLINLEYKQKLAEELDKQMQPQGKIKKKDSSSQGWQVLEEMMGQVSISKEGIKTEHPICSWDVVQEEQVQLQEQNLIDHAEQLFLEGKVDSAYVNYAEIDNCSDYDSDDLGDRDAEQRYFYGQKQQQQDERINRDYYTGIQDY